MYSTKYQTIPDPGLHNHHHHHQQHHHHPHHQHQSHHQQHMLAAGGHGGGGVGVARAPPAIAHPHHHQHQLQHHQNLQDPEHFPLRILVQSDKVGAIIGRSGNTIRQVTQQSKAKVDVNREEKLDPKEKVITISGTSESISLACVKILEIIQNEKLLQQQQQQQQTSLTENNQNVDGSSSTGTPETMTTSRLDLSNSEVTLRILAHNNLIGRLIGRNGNSIKKIMERTSTKINISVNSLTDCTNERTITVIGNMDQVRQAEQVISSKLRAAYMSDMNSTMDYQFLFNNLPMSYISSSYTQNPILSSLVGSQPTHGNHSMTRSMPAGSHKGQIPTRPRLPPYAANYLTFYPNISVAPQRHRIMGFNPNMGALEMEKETVHIYIPNSMVGAIIGKSGSAIKEMISQSGASIKVAAASASPGATNNPPTSNQTSKEEDAPPIETSQDVQTTNTDPNEPNSEVASSTNESPYQEQQQPSDPQRARDSSNHHSQTNHNYVVHNSPTRKVLIVGTPEAQSSAQFMIYRKVSMESGIIEASLTVEIQVPSIAVGKIIGKGGSTVKQIQKQTRTIIRLPDDRPSLSDTSNEPNDTGETSLIITGEFQNSQRAQRQIKGLIRESLLASTLRQNKIHQSNVSKQQNASYVNKSAQDNLTETQQHNDNHSQQRNDDNGSITTEGTLRPNLAISNQDPSQLESSADVVNGDGTPNEGEYAQTPQNLEDHESQIESCSDSRANNGDDLLISNNNNIDSNLNSNEETISKQAGDHNSDANDGQKHTENANAGKKVLDPTSNSGARRKNLLESRNEPA